MTRARLRGAVVVLAKAPRPGLVKTRMSPPFSLQQAADLSACMLSDVLAETVAASRSLGLEAVVAVHPADALCELASLAPPGFRVVAQHGSTLSERLIRAAAEAAATGASPILLRGSDSPLLSVQTHADALTALATNDVVVSPDRDGGYSLIGLRVPRAALFQHEMSTRSVLEDTLARAQAAGLRTHRLPPGGDIDTASDLAGLARACADGSAQQLCPRTLEFLDRCDGWRLARIEAPG